MKKASSLASLLLVAIFVLAPWAAAQSVEAGSATPLAKAVQPFLDDHTVAGTVVLVCDAQKVLAQEALGYADLEAKRPMRADSLFWIASMSKPITATALMMLVDEGKVVLDDPVEKYLPEFAGQMLVVEKDAEHALLKRPEHPITVREVLSHTSGLTPRSPLEQQIDLLQLSENVQVYPLLPLKFAPSSSYEYSNAGINTAGRIVEVVGGKPFAEFLQERLLGPLGMRDTTFWPSDEQVGRLAKSYKMNGQRTGLEETQIVQLTYPVTDRQRGACPAGGLFSTAADVARFCRMILNGGQYEGRRYVSEAAVRQMTSTHHVLGKDGGENGYGLGWTTSRKARDGDATVSPGPFGHGGAYATNMSIDPQRRLITVLMVQRHAMGPQGKKLQTAVRSVAETLCP